MPSNDKVHPWMGLLWLLILAGLPALVARWESRDTPRMTRAPTAMGAGAGVIRPPSPPPAVEPLAVYALDADRARALNAAIPFSGLINPAARPYIFVGSETDLARATDCLAAAEIFEAGDDATGEQAVAQTVLNRVRHPAFPKTVCGVVFQGQERTTGCQFTFSCDGALARTPSPAAWDRARIIARAALAGQVFKPVGYATHYHTNWVVPYWSGSLDKLTAVGTHLFFRWRGWWGTPPAFGKSGTRGEPLIPRLARFSPAHAVPGGDMPFDRMSILAAMASNANAAALAAQPRQAIGAESIGKMASGARLVAIAPGATTFLFELARNTAPDDWPAIALTFCAGRAQCRIMAWRPGEAPTILPLNEAQMNAMSFSYIHNIDGGLQRALWNCAQTPRANKAECMRQRIVTAAPAPPPPPPAEPALEGVRRRDRFETVRIAPVKPTAP